MPPNSLRSDCRKFVPNIFNKTKCSNCFKQKEEHTAEALECNRAMRKVSKSGYLFVAPGWDFSIPLNRNKRWQRRWFVLYDDGELNYSVDEHPDTVPQASIDMTQILEVATAEEVTGHAFSLAITAPDRVTFVKAMARDDARAWTNVLAVYTRNKKHKRNATFPGGQTTSIHQVQAPRCGTPNPIRPRYNSCHSESLRPAGRYFHETTENSLIPGSINDITQHQNQTNTGTNSPIGSLSTSSSSASVSSSSCRSSGYRDQPPSSASPPTRDKLNSEEKAAARTRTRTRTEQIINNNVALKNIKNNIESVDCVDAIVKSSVADDYETSSKRLETLKDIAAVLTRPRNISSAHLQTPTRDSDNDTTTSTTTPQQLNIERVQLPAETTLLNMKKGWLMLQDNEEWTKLWFVLCGQEFKAYKDPKSEELADEELTVVLSQVKTVGELQVQRNYGFQLRLWNDVVHTLSAVTAGIRSNWLLSIRRAAGLDDLPPRPAATPAATPATSPSPAIPGRFLSSDEEYRTASEGGRRESLEWTPVSPPLARTPISRVKERARSRRSSSSRGSTLDSVSTDELLAADELQNLHTSLQRSEQDKLICLTQLKHSIEKYEDLNRDYLTKTSANDSLQQELDCVNERLQRGIEENDFLYKKLQELEGKELQKNAYEGKELHAFGSLSDLTNIDLNLDLNNINIDHLLDAYNNLKTRFEKAILEIKLMKREIRDSNLKYDDLELTNITLTQDLKNLQQDNQSQNDMMAARIQDLTQKLSNSEKQVRNLKSKLQDSREKRRSLSLKGRESFSINKEVEDKITELEAKIRKIVKPTKGRVRRKSLDSATTSEPMKVLIRLSSLETKVKAAECTEASRILALESIIQAARLKLVECDEKHGVAENTLSEVNAILNSHLSPQEVDVISESVLRLVRNFEKLLREKLSELGMKRQKLRDSGMLTPESSMAMLAEKLAYETVLISRIHDALNNSEDSRVSSRLNTRFSSRILRREILETDNLLHQFQAKVSGAELTPKCLEEQLVHILTRHLINVNYITCNAQHIRNEPASVGGLEYLLQKQVEANQLLQKYKQDKLEQLACSLVNYAESENMLQLVTQERLSAELINTEINHVFSKVASAYTPVDSDTFMTIYAAERAALELWSDTVEQRIHQELETHSQELNIAVKGALKLKRKTEGNAKCLLAEYADVIAHKATIDARIVILKREVSGEKHVCVDIFEGERYLEILESNAVREAEFHSLFVRHQQVALASTATVATEIPKELLDALAAVEFEVARLQGTSVSTTNSNNSPVKRCKIMQETLSKIPQIVNCQQCPELKDSIHRLSREHSAELAVHESTQTQLRERARQLEQRLGTLDSEYAKQLDQLKAAYRETLTTPTPAAEASEGMRARYQSEIEQLRALCEKGLAAVESTHRRVVAELQDKHRREREQLLEEKEQALAEETQATLAALDAMRKAHEHEVRREVGKFKADFLRRLQATHDLGALHHQHESEMRDIKAEILALSERYSVKCVESASLEEQLCALHQQLQNANKYIEKLDKRNKQLETISTSAHEILTK